MVKKDASLAILIAFVTEGILNFDNITRSGTREVVHTHCDRYRSIEIDAMVVEFDVRPTLPAVDSEACIFVVPPIYGIATHKV